jgi:DNA-directed RNA polymerase
LHGIGPKYDTRKARAGVAPNFVHSLDAAHMQLAICHGLDQGIEDFFMIHDSFGTNAADTWAFYHNIRHAIVDMYEDNCVLSNFEIECRNRLANPDMELMQVPEKGDLDVRAVLESEYCFS